MPVLRLLREFEDCCVREDSHVTFSEGVGRGTTKAEEVCELSKGKCIQICRQAEGVYHVINSLRMSYVNSQSLM